MGKKNKHNIDLLPQNSGGSSSVRFRDVSGGDEGTVDFSNRTVKLRDQSGRLVTMDLGQTDVHIDRALANYASGFKLAEACADHAAPPIPTANASDKFFRWEKDDVFQQVTDIITAPGAAVKEINPRLSTDSYTTVQYAVGAFIPTEIEANADSPLQPSLQAMRRCMSALILAREVRVATMLQTAGNWDSSVYQNLGSGAKWNGGGSSDPVGNLLTAIQKSLMPVTGIVISEACYHAFVQNAAVQKYIVSKINVPGLPSPEQITGSLALLGLPPIHIAAMKYKSPTAGTYGYVWGNDVVLLHQSSTLPSDGQSIASAYTFRWNGGNVGDATVDGGFIVRSFFNQFRGPRGGRQIVVTHNDAEKMTSNIVGGLIKGALQ